MHVIQLYFAFTYVNGIAYGNNILERHEIHTFYHVQIFFTMINFSVIARITTLITAQK
jgi:hypothetical protein